MGAQRSADNAKQTSSLSHREAMPRLHKQSPTSSAQSRPTCLDDLGRIEPVVRRRLMAQLALLIARRAVRMIRDEDAPHAQPPTNTSR